VTAWGVQLLVEMTLVDNHTHHDPHAAKVDEANHSRHRLKLSQLKGQACPVGYDLLKSLSPLVAAFLLLLHMKSFRGVVEHSGRKLAAQLGISLLPHPRAYLLTMLVFAVSSRDSAIISAVNGDARDEMAGKILLKLTGRVTLRESS
jgi:hypothetical protein